MSRAKTENLLAFRKALVVEPVAHLRQMTVGLLKNTTLHEVAMCSSPVEAIKMIQLHDTDLVLCGSTHGASIVLTEMLRQGSNSPNRYVTVVELACHADYKSVVFARDKGVNTVLAVPFSANDLARRLISLSRSNAPFVEVATYVGPDRRQQVKPISHEDRRLGSIPDPAPHSLTCQEILQRFIDAQKKRRMEEQDQDKKTVAAGITKGKELLQDTQTLRCTANDLKPEMTLLRNVVSRTGLTIVSSGTSLNKRTILRLTDMVQAGEVEDFFFVGQ